jgi:hypothetical protein
MSAMTRYIYSASEIELFRVIPGAFFDDSIAAPMLYRTAVEHCFLNNLQGPAVEALRKAAKCLLTGEGPYRFTNDFEDLLIF